MDKVRFVIVGAGVMGKVHAKNMKTAENSQLVAICDVNREAGEALAREYGVKYFDKYEDCFESGEVEAAIVATPHYFHPPIAVAAMERGIHVLCEKPLAVTVSEADRMAEEATKSGVRYGVMFQRRTHPAFRKARELIDSGALGEIWRTMMVETEWFRPQAYYNSGGWRGTWAGEGGGVLMNQAPHSLDIFTWLTGLPAKVDGRVATLHHDIEVEDTASAMLTYANGGSGYFTTSTWEYPGESMIRVIGSEGVLQINGRKQMRMGKSTPGALEFSRTSQEMFGTPKVEWTEIKTEEAPWGSAVVAENFAQSVRDGRELTAPGVDGGRSLELANAIVLSSYKGKPVTLPIDREEYDKLLRKLVKSSKARK